MSGDTTARGYGTAHQNARRRWARTVHAGDAICARCQQPIAPDTPWDLDHTEDRSAYLGAAHRHCNRSAGGRKGAAATHRTTTAVFYDW